MNKLLRFGLIAVAVLAVLWGALLLLLRLVFPPEKIQALVLERAKAALHRDVTLKGASVHVFPFVGLSLDGMAVANHPDTANFSREPLVELGSLDVQLSVASLLRMQPVVRQIVLDHPRVRIEVLADGRSSLDGLGGAPDTAKASPRDSAKPLELPFPLSVERIAIVGGSVAWLDRKAQSEFTVGSIDQEIGISTDASLQNVQSKGTLRIRDVAIGGQGAPVRKGGINLALDHDLSLNLPAAKVEVRSLRLGFQQVGIKVSGKAENIRVAPVVDLKIGTDGALDLAKLLAEVPKELNPSLAKLSLAGTFSLDAAVAGKLGDSLAPPKVDATVRLAGLEASVQGIPAKLSGLGSRIKVVATRHVEIDSTRWSLDGAPGSLDLVVDSLPVGALRSVPVLRKLAASGKIDLEALHKVLGPAVVALDSLKPTGTVGWNIQAAGRLDPKEPKGITASGELTFAKVATSVKGLPDRPVVDGSVNLSNDKAGAKLGVVAGPTDVSADLSIQDWMAFVVPSLAEGRKMTVGLSLHSRRIDLDRLLPPPDTGKAPERKPTTELPTLPDVVADGSFQAGEILAFGMAMKSVVGKIRLEKGQIKQSFGAEVAQGKVSQTLSADLSNPKVLGLDATSNFAGIQIHDVLVALKDRLPEGNPRKFHDKLHGRGSIVVHAWGKAPVAEFGQKMSADVSLALAQGKIASFPAVASMTGKAHEYFPSIPAVGDLDFATLAGEIKLREGKMILEGWKFDGSQLGAMDLSGTIGTDQALDLKADTHLPQAVSSVAQSGSAAVVSKLGLPSGSVLPQDDQKRVVVSWKIQGPASGPTVTPDLPRLTDLAKGAALLLAAEAKAQLEAKVKAEADRVKAEAQARVDAEKAKARQAVEEQKNKAVDQAKDKLKGLIKKPW